MRTCTRASVVGEGAQSAAGPRATRGRALAVIVAVACLLRAFVILAPGSALYLADGQPDFEELLRGIAAKEIVDGPLLPLQDYQVNDFWGGSLVTSIVAAPFVAVLGPNLLALRISPLLFHLFSTACVFLILDRFAGRRAAWIGGLLMAIPPPGYTFTSSSTFSLHTEGNALALLLTYLYFAYRARPASRALAWGVGCVAGFAIYFAYGLLVPIAVLLGLELLRDKAFFLRRSFLWGSFGFVVGLAPWIRYQVLHGLRGPVVYGTDLRTHFHFLDPAFIADKLAGLVRTGAPDSFWFQDALGVDGVLLGGAAALVFAVLALLAAWQSRDAIRQSLRGLVTRRPTEAPSSPVVFALGFVLLYIAAYAVSGFGFANRSRPQEYRYLMPLYPFLVILAAYALDVFADRGRVARAAAAATTVALCLAFGVATVRLSDVGRFGASLDEPAYSVEHLARFVLRRVRDDTDALERVVTRMEAHRSPQVQDELLFAMACGYRGLLLRPDRQRRHDSMRASLAFLHERVAEPYKPYFEADPPRVYRSHEREQFWRDYGADQADGPR